MNLDCCDCSCWEYFLCVGTIEKGICQNSDSEFYKSLRDYDDCCDDYEERDDKSLIFDDYED